MKKNEIVTIEDLKNYLTDYCEQNPEDDCCELVRDICEENKWVYTSDSELDYDDEDFSTDGMYRLCIGEKGWITLQEEGVDIEYEGREVTVKEDGQNWYVDFNTGLGEGIYPKADWTLKKALHDQAHMHDQEVKVGKKYQVYYDNNVESSQVAEFETLEEAKEYCDEEVKGYEYAGVGSPDESRNTSHCYEVYEGSPVDDESTTGLKDPVYSTGWYYNNNKKKQ